MVSDLKCRGDTFCGNTENITPVTVIVLITYIIIHRFSIIYMFIFIQVLAYDEHGLVSHLLNFDIYVLANPCVNNARCEGPSWDTSCSDTARINGVV